MKSDVYVPTDANLVHLKANSYPGRMIVAGLSEDGYRLVQVYAIMGRSDSSRNRIFKNDHGIVSTALADPTKAGSQENLKLILYTAMTGCNAYPGGESDSLRFIVSNGNQTDALAFAISNHHASPYEELQEWMYEPDAPNFTPRITAISSTGRRGPRLMMSIIKRMPDDGDCRREFYCFDELPKGIGYCFTTYERDGKPLPSFTRKPFPLPLRGDEDGIVEQFWDPAAAYFPNLVSVAVKTVSIEQPYGGSRVVIKNKFAPQE